MSIPATFLSANAFSVASDKAAEFVAGVRVQADCGTDGMQYGTSAGYSGTTVTLSMDSGSTLTARLTGVLHGNDTPQSAALPRLAAECRLTLSGANLLLSRSDGYRVIIDDAPQIIPAAGVLLAPAGLAANTIYFIYVAMPSGSMTLEATTTAYVQDSRNGVLVKSDDRTRTLVGMARTIAGPAWADTAAQRFVLSYYNRRYISVAISSSTQTGTSSSTYIDLAGAVIYFLCWPDEAFQCLANMRVTTAGAYGIGSGIMNLDGSTIVESEVVMPVVASSPYNVTGAMSMIRNAGQGYHCVKLQGRWSVGATVYFDALSLKCGING